LRAVADTNVVVSGLLWLGMPGRILEAAANGRVSLFTSPALVRELFEVMNVPKLARRLEAAGLPPEELMQRYLDVVMLVEPQAVPNVVPDDPDDNEVVAAAIASEADLIISGDGHLLDLGRHAGIRIITPAQAVGVISGQ